MTVSVRRCQNYLNINYSRLNLIPIIKSKMVLNGNIMLKGLSVGMLKEHIKLYVTNKVPFCNESAHFVDCNASAPLLLVKN